MTSNGTPLEEYPTRWQAKGSIALKSSVPGFEWVIEKCPVKRTKFHIRARVIEPIPDTESVVSLTADQVALVLNALDVLGWEEPDLRKRLESGTHGKTTNGQAFLHSEDAESGVHVHGAERGPEVAVLAEVDGI